MHPPPLVDLRPFVVSLATAEWEEAPVLGVVVCVGPECRSLQCFVCGVTKVAFSRRPQEELRQFVGCLAPTSGKALVR